jgi:molybdenum cofactor cytidylyltransferase
VPVHDRKRGNPILWPARHFAEMRRLEGDRGARDLLSRHDDEITWVPVSDEGVNLDVDTPETLRELVERAASRSAGGASRDDED